MNKMCVLLLCLGLYVFTAQAAIKHSRAEGLPELFASNTVGLGDIWLSIGFSSYFKTLTVHNDVLTALVDSSYQKDIQRVVGSDSKVRRDILVAPDLHGIIGLTNFLHLEITNTPWDGEKIGATTAHLKLTTPGNDNLRVLGIAISMNATLATDESAKLSGKSTPGFDPQLSVTAIADADLIKWWPSFPMKLYFNYSNLDEVRLAHTYEQHVFQVAWEYKSEKVGYYVKAGAYLYKPLPNPSDSMTKLNYLPLFYDIGFGYKKNVLDKFSCVAGASIDLFKPFAFYSSESHKSPKLFFQITGPLWQQETRAEAIRALIFHEQKRNKVKTQKADQKNISTDSKNDSTMATPALQGVQMEDILGTQSVQDVKEKNLMQDVFEDEASDLLEKRKQIRGELKQIEEQLE